MGQLHISYKIFIYRFACLWRANCARNTHILDLCTPSISDQIVFPCTFLCTLMAQLWHKQMLKTAASRAIGDFQRSFQFRTQRLALVAEFRLSSSPHLAVTDHSREKGVKMLQLSPRIGVARGSQAVRYFEKWFLSSLDSPLGSLHDIAGCSPLYVSLNLSRQTIHL